MQKMMKGMISLLAIICCANAFAQSANDSSANGETNSFTPWRPIKEENILWAKTVWRVLNLADKSNAPLSNNGSAFPGVLLHGIKTGAIKAFADKGLSQQLSQGSVDNMTYCSNPDNCTYSQAVTHYGLKEDWIYDDSQGLMVVHILLFAPLMDDNGTYKPLFWISYPDSRPYFSKYRLTSSDKEINGLTWDEYFESRSFSSKVTRVDKVKLSNVRNTRKIRESRITRHKVRNTWPKD